MSGRLQPTKEEIETETNKFKETPTPQLQESLYVHDVYNEIAQHFSQTRYKPWPIVTQFIESRELNSIGVDVGCGNGKYLNINPNVYMVGSDYSTGLIDQAHQLHSTDYNNDTIVADGLSLPHSNHAFDFVISIAVIHHFSTRERRIDCIIEILRILKKGGRALIYCWALEQEKSRRGYKEGMDQDVLVPWVQSRASPKKKSKKQPPKKGEVVEQEEATEKEEEKQPETKMRFYHLYKKGELEEDCVSAGGSVYEAGYERDNWWVVAEKL